MTGRLSVLRPAHSCLSAIEACRSLPRRCREGLTTDRRAEVGEEQVPARRNRAGQRPPCSGSAKVPFFEVTRPTRRCTAARYKPASIGPAVLDCRRVAIDLTAVFLDLTAVFRPRPGVARRAL